MALTLLDVYTVPCDMGILETGREDVVSVDPETSVKEIAQTMFDYSVGSVLVVDNGTLEGIVTDRDLARSSRYETDSMTPSGRSWIALVTLSLVAVDPGTVG